MRLSQRTAVKSTSPSPEFTAWDLITPLSRGSRSNALRSAAAHHIKCGRTGAVRQHDDRLPYSASRCEQQRSVSKRPPLLDRRSALKILPRTSTDAYGCRDGGPSGKLAKRCVAFTTVSSTPLARTISVTAKTVSPLGQPPRLVKSCAMTVVTVTESVTVMPVTVNVVASGRSSGPPHSPDFLQIDEHHVRFRHES